MPPRGVPLRLYGVPSDLSPLGWEWVEDQLAVAGVYWVVARGPGHPHPRPVWGVWSGERLHLSVGSPHVVAALRADPVVTVHLGGDVDVVVVEGLVDGEATEVAALRRYDAKYEWRYSAAENGDLFVVRPRAVTAWRAAGRAGRDGFVAAGRWSFDVPAAGE